MIKSITDTEENLAGIAQRIGDSPWEKLPYNDMAGAKYAMLNMKYVAIPKEKTFYINVSCGGAIHQ